MLLHYLSLVYFYQHIFPFCCLYLCTDVVSQRTCPPARRPPGPRQPSHSPPQSAGYQELGTLVVAWGPGWMATRKPPTPNGGRGVSYQTGHPFSRPAGFVLPEGEVLFSFVGYQCLMLQIWGGTQLHLTRLRGTGRARKASSLSAPCSALSSALCSRVHCPSICLGSAEQGACEQPDTSGLQRDPFFSATCTGAVTCTLPCIVPLAHEGDS